MAKTPYRVAGYSLPPGGGLGAVERAVQEDYRVRYIPPTYVLVGPAVYMALVRDLEEPICCAPDGTVPAPVLPTRIQTSAGPVTIILDPDREGALARGSADMDALLFFSGGKGDG